MALVYLEFWYIGYTQKFLQCVVPLKHLFLLRVHGDNLYLLMINESEDKEWGLHRLNPTHVIS